MAIRKIIKGDDPVLRQRSRVVEKFDARLWQLLDDMVQTMRAAEGCGLAAVQVGVLKRVAVIETENAPLLELINPEIVERHGHQREKEGCLSFPGESGITLRPMVVKLKAQNRHGQWCFFKLEALRARAAAHECDHLDGVLFHSHLLSNS